MFNNGRFLTRGINNEIPPEMQIFLWLMIDDLKNRKIKPDYLQVFTLSRENGRQKIKHSQEQPKYAKNFLIDTENTIMAKIFVIDDGEHSTMMLAEEY